MSITASTPASACAAGQSDCALPGGGIGSSGAGVHWAVDVDTAMLGGIIPETPVEDAGQLLPSNTKRQAGIFKPRIAVDSIITIPASITPTQSLRLHATPSNDARLGTAA
ncbi:hypothetical protein BJ741DRAFT_658837 [Chytriomyces cf. hyalinus JEL632]|nr:hypothetical protein BJ741DRAFT_658837 [Chytriomyces cf. hyalinus JEL632]